MKLKIAVLPGDGIGPEVTAQAIKVLEAIALEYDHQFFYEYADVGAIAIDKHNNPLPDKTLKLCRNSDAVLFGAIGDPKYDNAEGDIRPEQSLLKLRKELELFANIRPITAFDTLIEKSPLKRDNIIGVNISIYRELTSGIYFGKKGMDEKGDYAYDTCEYHASEIERIAHLAFKAAKERRQKVTLIDKANVLESSRLWRKTVTQLAKSYPDVALEFLYIDNAAMQMILNPKQFDVILTGNMFGDIISDEASVIGGSIGLLPSASIGRSHAMFEPIHGSYPQATGKNIANPIAAILSAGMLLEHFNLHDEAEAIKVSVEKSINVGITTPDLGEKHANMTTSKVGDFIADIISNPDDTNYNFSNINLGQSTII